MFSAKHSFADMRECNLKKNQKFNKNRGWFARMQKGVFCHFLGFGGFVFFSLCFCASVLYKIAQNGYFPACLRGFLSILFPQKACLKLFLFFLFCFFAFVFPFKNPFFLCFLSINPFLEKTLCGVSFVFLLLAFSFPNVCLFIWNKLS